MSDNVNKSGNARRKNRGKKLTKRQEAINWRRGRVMKYHMMGLSESDIARQLQISQPTISNDITFIREESAEQIQTLISKELPLQWRKCRTALQFIQNGALAIYRDAKTDGNKLAALQLFGESQKEEFVLVSDSTMIDEAIKWVKAKNIDAFLKHVKEQEAKKQQQQEQLIIVEAEAGGDEQVVEAAESVDTTMNNNDELPYTDPEPSQED